MENSPLGVVAGGFSCPAPRRPPGARLDPDPGGERGGGGLEDMAEYKIIPSLEGYSVEVRARGSFLSTTGFPSEAAAAAWIVEQKIRDVEAVKRAERPVP